MNEVIAKGAARPVCPKCGKALLVFDVQGAATVTCRRCWLNVRVRGG